MGQTAHEGTWHRAWRAGGDQYIQSVIHSPRIKNSHELETNPKPWLYKRCC